MVEISILICTYNRADYLPGAITSGLEQSMGPNRYEVLVVDNNSSDGTRAVVERYEQKYSNVRYVVEERQGLNFARTRGAQEAKGKYVAYLDDDARAEQTWLERVLEAFERQSPNPVCVGGKILLDWEGPRPAWYPEEFQSLLAYIDHGNEGFYLKANVLGHYLIGTNIAFMRQTVLDMGGFRTHCGRLKRRDISGAETEMINRILRAGLPVYYAPDAVVHHIVVPQRRTKKFLIRRLKGDGATQPLIDLDRKDFRNMNLSRRIVYDAKASLKLLIKASGYSVLGKKKLAFTHFLYAVQKWGRTEMELRFLYDKEFAPLWRQRHQRFE